MRQILEILEISNSISYFFPAFVIPFHSTEFNLMIPKSKYVMDSYLRSAYQLPREYDSLQLLHRFANSTVAPGIIPFQALALKFSLYCNWMLLAHWDSLGFLSLILPCAELCIVILWSGFLELAGNFHSTSVKNRISWRKLAAGDKFLTKWRKAVRPLFFGQEGFHKIKRLSVLKFWKAIIRGTFRTLLTYRSI